MGKLTGIEREFTATIADDEDKWHVATASLKYVSRLKKLGWVPVETNEWGYSFFEVPRRCISFRSVTPKKMSKSGIEALSKRMSKLNTEVHTTKKRGNIEKG